MMRAILALAGALSLSGCVSHSIAERIAGAEQIAATHGFSRLAIVSRDFELTAYVGPARPGSVLHVYIEGDGFAWVTRYQPSRNPTPIDPVALKLAVRDGQNAAYLARPCQYVAVDEKGCAARFWTSARFGHEVVDAMNEAVTQLRERARAQTLVLIGYSGGAAIAALIAARRDDVVHLVTVAGNLDPRAWADGQGVAELRDSLNPADAWPRLAGIRQTHFVGEQDRTIPFAVYRSYRRAFPPDADISATIVPRMDHGCCWDRVWPDLLNALR